MTHYDTLGAAPGASAAELRAAYLRLARRLHPDALVGRPAAEVAAAGARLVEVNRAWEVLGDPDARRAYDATLRAEAAPRPSTAPSSPPRSTPARPTSPRGASYEPATRPASGRGCAAVLAIVAVGGLLVSLGVALAVVTLAGGFRGGGGPPTTSTLPPSQTGGVAAGQCVQVRAQVAVVGCATANDGRILAVVPATARCAGSDVVEVPYDERFVLCVRPAGS